MPKTVTVTFPEADVTLVFAQREGEGHITYLDKEGNHTPHAVWFELLKLFATRKIGPSVLKEIARLLD